MSNSGSTEYKNILTKGLKSALNSTAIEDGKLRFTTDSGELFLDVKENGSSAGNRLKISDIIDNLTESEILETLAALPKIYLSSDTHRAFVNDGTKWIDLAALKLSLADIADVDLPVWFSATDAEHPSYSTDITYNTSKKELKSPKVVASSSMTVNGMLITDTKDSNNVHTVEFSFV